MAEEDAWRADPGEPESIEDALTELAAGDMETLEAAVAEIAHRAFVPHDGGQLDVMQSEARFRVLRAGRRWGKTKLAAHETIAHAVAKPNQIVWWVANTYRNVARGYKEVVRQLPPSLLKKAAPAYTSNTLYLQLANGTVIEFYSGGSPDALAGEGVDFMVVDEGALIPDNVWNQMLRPTLMDKGGHAIIISTPRGHNWFWRLWNLGEKADAREYASWHFPQTANPYVPLEETEAVREELPAIIFQQEIMAEFVAAGASIFGEGLNRDGVVLDQLAPPEGHVFVGIDLAKKDDFTVISASNYDTRLPCHLERFNDLNWPAQRARIHAAAEYLEQSPGVKTVTIGIDSTGIGDVIYDDLLDEGLEVIPITFNNAWKEAAVKLLATKLEKAEAHIVEEQLSEFGAYSMEVTAAGRLKFEAVAGHDDQVSAKLIEEWIATHEGPGGVVIVDASPAAQGQRDADRVATTPLRELRPSTPEERMARAAVWH